MVFESFCVKISHFKQLPTLHYRIIVPTQLFFPEKNISYMALFDSYTINDFSSRKLQFSNFQGYLRKNVNKPIKKQLKKLWFCGKSSFLANSNMKMEEIEVQEIHHIDAKSRRIWPTRLFYPTQLLRFQKCVSLHD